ncbi:MAG: two-component regulator propeller domain-containing protein, partial [Ferruginibacter sp.]
MKKAISILFVCLLIETSAYSQQQSFFWGNDEIHFHTDTNAYQTKVFGTQNGLPSSEITSLAQDSKGYIWVGSSAGASRFDGMTFTNYLKSGSRFTGKVYCIKEDTLRKIIWMAGDGGLFYFKNNKLYSVDFKEPTIAVYYVHLLKNQSIWIGTGKGPVYLDLAAIDTLLSGTKISIKSLLIPEWAIVSGGNPAYKIMNSESGNIYFAGEGRLFSFINKKLSLIWLSNRQQDNNDQVTGMVQSNNDTIIFATVFSGIYYVKNNTVQQAYRNDGHVSADL